MEKIKSAFAPVNIAWIKYMGKENGQPLNSSLSLTLKNTGTFVRMDSSTSQEPLAKGSFVKINFEVGSYIPPLKGIEKLQKFLSSPIWLETLAPFNYPVSIPNEILVFTKNNAPAGSGIATSASSFAAFTLAWVTVLVGAQAEQLKEQFLIDPRFRKKLAWLASQGSGSACRSIDGPWVEWDKVEGVTEWNAQCEQKWGDLIFVVDSSPKQVTSSEAHLRVKASPVFSGRVARAHGRLAQLKFYFSKSAPRFSEIQKCVWEESQDMHSLFHTSVPPFKYQTEKSLMIAQAVIEEKSLNGIVTMDAGANVHVFFPIEQKAQWKEFANRQFPETPIILDEQGDGAIYVDPNFTI